MSFRHILNRLFKKPGWHNLRLLHPVSRKFGFDRGTPIDRYYIEKFLQENRQHIRGAVLEIAGNTYSRKFGNGVEKYEILHYDSSNPLATIIGDLTKPETLPKEKIDCFICTQTFNFIYNFQDAIKGAYHLLKPNGVLLATVAGITQISRYDMDRWGDYWRFTNLSVQKSFADVFGDNNVKVMHYGNVLSCIGILHGLASEELTKEELDFMDEDYQLIITVSAQKNAK